jgi:uncharacterized protein
MGIEIGYLDDPQLLLEINNAAVPDVGVLDEAKARWLTHHVMMPGLALLDGRPVGLVVVLSDRCSYNSDYYRWFTERYDNFLYVDRVVIKAEARGQGIGKQLYKSIEAMANELKLAIASDVYCEPPNTPSLHFHHKMGFQEVGQQPFPAINKICAKLLKYPERAKMKDGTGQ